MESIAIIKAAAALLFVIGLIGIAALLARKYGPGKFVAASMGRGREKRLKVLETLPLDAKRRLVLIKRDGTEHLLLLGLSQDILVERGIRMMDDGE